MTVLFWSSIVLIAYIFVGFPLALRALVAVRPRPWRRDPSHEPPVSFVIAAHNEAASILNKINNLLSLDYPAGSFEILVGSDGSTDGTARQLMAITDPRVRVLIDEQRRGKPSMLNTLVARASGEIVVFADVRQTFDNAALRALTQPFADPQVGAVTGELKLRKSGSEEAPGLYWRYEKFIRSQECLIDSTMVVTGAMYAIRRTLFEPVPADTICDDLVIPMRITRRGYRVVFSRDAISFDAMPPTDQEFTRKVRTLAGAFQFFARQPWVFSVRQNRLWWQTMSHKAMRLLIAPLQLIALATNVALAQTSPFYSAILAAQLVFYAGAAAALLLPRSWKRPRALSFPYIFCVLSVATVVGFFRWITHRQPVTWRKAAA